MICEKCQNDYPSSYYFATPTICKTCFEKLTPEEKSHLLKLSQVYTNEQAINLRVSFGKRFLAALVDTLILLVIVLAFYKFTWFFESYFSFFQEIKDLAGDRQALQEFQQQFMRENALNFAFPGIVYLIYFLPEAFFGISLGKYLLGLKIAKANGEEADKGSLWLRYLVKNLSSIMTLVWVVTQLSIFNVLNSIFGFAVLLGFLLILGRNKQNIQDIVAKTAVFKTEVLEELSKTKVNEGTNLG
jgi:uncharacterized RDD family membrane protein YckC